ncbi:hypothetical protein CEE69_10565 [Rhodopirellula bahusiensis]|uniref:Uncharacterized protein n=1 Tax=Rhodopirellula bahusiensis TaxID=2014065 RepID=A0A2G1W8R6_9BACT|nr:hypothetical protein CEE69_10565 [Rhodopirellula bahusiensis]
MLIRAGECRLEAVAGCGRNLRQITLVSWIRISTASGCGSPRLGVRLDRLTPLPCPAQDSDGQLRVRVANENKSLHAMEEN